MNTAGRDIVNRGSLDTVFLRRMFAMNFAGISKPKKCRKKEHDKVALHLP